MLVEGPRPPHEHRLSEGPLQHPGRVLPAQRGSLKWSQVAVRRNAQSGSRVGLGSHTNSALVSTDPGTRATGVVFPQQPLGPAGASAPSSHPLARSLALQEAWTPANSRPRACCRPRAALLPPA